MEKQVRLHSIHHRNATVQLPNNEHVHFDEFGYSKDKVSQESADLAVQLPGFRHDSGDDSFDAEISSQKDAKHGKAGDKHHEPTQAEIAHDAKEDEQRHEQERREQEQHHQGAHHQHAPINFPDRSATLDERKEFVEADAEAHLGQHLDPNVAYQNAIAEAEGRRPQHPDGEQDEKAEAEHKKAEQAESRNEKAAVTVDHHVTTLDERKEIVEEDAESARHHNYPFLNTGQQATGIDDQSERPPHPKDNPPAAPRGPHIDQQDKAVEIERKRKEGTAVHDTPDAFAAHPGTANAPPKSSHSKK
jgi:hypothetical protein